MNIKRFLSDITTPRTRYLKGEVENQREAEAARNVASIESEVNRAADQFRSLQPGSNLNGKPEHVYGRIQLNGYGQEGSCKFGSDGSVEKLNLGEGTLSYEKRGDRVEMGRKSELHGSGRGGSDTNVTEEWVIMDGPKVSYKKFDYWLGY
jgi:hypothetical protein